ncbi:MAG: hypothetical protein J6U59_05375 [Alistipes sp.]|nr:hypothetical protein [Alistipes sp.]
MKSIYKYMVLAVALMLSTATMAQERVDEKLVYDRITGYMTTESEVEKLPVEPSKNIQDVRWEHDLSLWYGAPGLVSELLLGNQVFGDADYGPLAFGQSLHELRTYTGPIYQLTTLGLSYSKSLQPWLALGAKATFGAAWQNVYDTYTDELLYNNNVYNIAALFDVRFNWLRRTNVEMYSSVALGLLAHAERANGGIAPMADVAFVGIKVGRGFYGFVEVGAGVGGSVRGGLGFRFNTKK